MLPSLPQQYTICSVFKMAGVLMDECYVRTGTYTLLQDVPLISGLGFVPSGYFSKGNDICPPLVTTGECL